MRNLIVAAMALLCIGASQANAAGAWEKWAQQARNELLDKKEIKVKGIETLIQWRDNTCPFAARKDACVAQYNLLITQLRAQIQVFEAMILSTDPQSQAFFESAREDVNRMNADQDIVAYQVFKLFPPVKTKTTSSLQ